ncbi:MAG: winged helix-turn-helix transcriptional regulator [Acidimicrobiaceae bacterium]|nr:winged helix-turn-helix transcriptional regulator [Acidimicrobiaceae bacterium]
MDERTYNIVGALAIALHDQIMGAVEKGTDFSASASAALVNLLAFPNETIDTLSGPIGLTGSGTVRLVDRLVAAELVERRVSDRDRRSVELVLTNKGRKVAQRALNGRRAAIAKALSVLTQDEKNSFSRAAEKVLAALTGDRHRADLICRLCDYQFCPQEICPVEQAVE